MNFDSDLYYAAAFSDIEGLQSILESEDYDINTQHPKNGNTPLYIAAAWGSHDERVGLFYIEIVRLLLDYGADVNLRNYTGKSPLYISSSWGHANIVKILIRYGANLNEKMDEGRTALHIACLSAPRYSRSGHGKYPHYSRNYKYQAYQVARDFVDSIVGSGQYLEFLDDWKEDFKKLLSHTTGSPGDEIPDDVMDVVVYYNHFATVVELVQAGCEFHAQDDWGQTPLAKAAFSGHLGIVKFLVDRGADINAVDQYNRKAVDMARQRNHPIVVQYLNQLHGDDV